MSMSINVMVPKLTEAGFVHFCRRQKWMEPMKQGNRLYTCVDAQAISGIQSQPEGRRYVPAQHALWYDLVAKQVGYDGDFTNLRTASRLFINPADHESANRLADLTRRMGYARGADAVKMREEVNQLTGKVRASDEVLLCEGLADALAADLPAEIVLEDGQYVLDVEVEDTLEQEVGLAEVTL